jgi:hypothetical protein
MPIAYFVICPRHQLAYGSHLAHRVHTAEELNNILAIDRPSECVWLVPGTEAPFGWDYAE